MIWIYLSRGKIPHGTERMKNVDVQKYEWMDVAHKAYSEIEGNNISVEKSGRLKTVTDCYIINACSMSFRDSALQRVCSLCKFW